MKYVLFLILSISSTHAQIPYPPDSILHLSNVSVETTDQFKKLIVQIAEERWLKNDHSFVEKTFHDNYISTSENGRSRTKKQILNNRTPARAAASVKEAEQVQMNPTIQNLVVQVYGDAAVAHYLVDMQLRLNNQAVYKLFRCTDTFIKEKMKWTVVSHSETVIPGHPTAVKIDTTVYTDYVGEYRLAPVATYTVSTKSGRLYWGKNQQMELVPESESMFAFKLPLTSNSPNSLYRIRFVRDDKNRVTHLRMIEFPGVEYDVTKMK